MPRIALTGILLLAVCVLGFWAGTQQTAPAPTDAAVTAAARHRGVCWVGSRATDGHEFDPLVATHANWISVTPFGWQRAFDSPHVALSTGRVYWGEADVGLRATAGQAHVRGLNVMMKPHVWIRGTSGDEWRGTLDFPNDEDWRNWHDSYRTFLLHYARLAEDCDMAMLCIGTELSTSARKHPDFWRALIQDVRQVYGGELIYAANWADGYEKIQFWDDLDYIGVQGYFPCRTNRTPPSRISWRVGNRT